MGAYVVKLGGSSIAGREDLNRLCGEVAAMAAGGAGVVVVHGGGPEISAEMERRGIEPVKVAGLRVTDDAALEAAEDVLRRINARVVESLERAGADAVGVPGYFVAECRRKAPVETAGGTVDLMNVGEVASADAETVGDLLAHGVVPVVYPIGADAEGRHLNVNADTMAAGIAAGIGCEEMVQVTDVPGILLDIGDPSTRQDVLTLGQIDALLADGTISGGMVPKVEACRRALEAGVARVRMTDGRGLRSAASGGGCGTVVVRRALEA